MKKRGKKRGKKGKKGEKRGKKGKQGGQKGKKGEKRGKKGKKGGKKGKKGKKCVSYRICPHEGSVTAQETACLLIRSCLEAPRAHFVHFLQSCRHINTLHCFKSLQKPLRTLPKRRTLSNFPSACAKPMFSHNKSHNSPTTHCFDTTA